MDFDQIINILTVYLPQIITLASVITAVTPTPRDEELLGKFYKIIEIFALNIGKAKE
jgi:hypothetical protein